MVLLRNFFILSIGLLMVICTPVGLLAQDEETNDSPFKGRLGEFLRLGKNEDEDNGQVGDKVDEENDGPVRLIGKVGYSTEHFLLELPNPYVTLYALAPYFSNDEPENYYWLRDAQELGKVITDPSVSPFDYELSLPIEPNGPTIDVDNDNLEEAGVQIFAVHIVSNLTGDPYLDLEYGDTVGWYSSAIWGGTTETEEYIVNGKLLVYAGDHKQEFPSGFGPDGLLFTFDEPTTALNKGYTVVDLSQEPFHFDRSTTPQVDLLQQPSDEPHDFSDLTYADAFDQLLELLTEQYAFSDFYRIDWDALVEDWRPRMVAAEAEENYNDYITTLYDFVNTFQDGHIGIDYDVPPERLDEYRGSLGLVLQEVSTGQVYVVDVVPTLPAANAGIEIGAEILSIDGLPIQEAIDSTIPFYASGRPPAEQWRLIQTNYVERGPVRSRVAIRYRSTDDGGRVMTKNLRRVENWDALFLTRPYEPNIPDWPLPVEFDYLGNSSYGYLRYHTFSDDAALTLALWDRAILNLNHYEMPGLVIDLRYNEGGSLHMAMLTASYFFDEPYEIGKFGYYDEELDDFHFDDYNISITPIPSGYHYDGEIVLLIGPDCVSACEFFSYVLSKSERAKSIGYYGSPGFGGTVDTVTMPDDVIFYFTAGRAVDADGKVHIEGTGIQPDIITPITKENLFSPQDPLLQAAQFQLGIMITSRER
ncbi:MAG: S41 family peptidase [Chloroflexota bacterium]